MRVKTCPGRRCPMQLRCQSASHNVVPHREGRICFCIVGSPLALVNTTVAVFRTFSLRPSRYTDKRSLAQWRYKWLRSMN